MEKIDLNNLLYEKGESIIYQDSPDTQAVAYTGDSVLEIMKHVWNLAVDECKKSARIVDENNLDEFDNWYQSICRVDRQADDEDFIVSPNSIEQVKQMI